MNPNKSIKIAYAFARHRIDPNKLSKTAYAYAKHRMDPDKNQDPTTHLSSIV